MDKIHAYLKNRGEQLDAEIAAATRIPLEDVRVHLTEMAKKGDIIACHSTRFVRGRKTEGMLCRISGYIPPAAPGRKAKPKPTAA